MPFFAMTLPIGLIALPALEIVGFVMIGPYLGVAGTLGFVLLSAVLGLALLRKEGIAALLRLRRELAEGGAPLPVALDGACRMAAALLLIAPGFFSTFAGLILLLPPVRGWLVRWFATRLEPGEPGSRRFRFGGAAERRATVIDGEYREIRRPDRDLPPGG